MTNLVPFEPKKKKRNGSGGGHAEDGDAAVLELNQKFAFTWKGSYARVLDERNIGPGRWRPDFLRIPDFIHEMNKRSVSYRTPDGTEKVMPLGRYWMQSPLRRDFRGLTFQPGVEDTGALYNLWRGFSVEPKAKPHGYAVFRDHLITNVCGGDEDLFRWVFGWFAHIVQRPRERVGTAIVIRGKMGTGKTKVGEVFGSLFPANYVTADSPHLVTGHFNEHLRSCLLLQADEAFWAGDKAAEGRLKGLITSGQQMVEGKGIDAEMAPNYVHLLVTSNESWVIPAGKDERRFCVIDVGEGCAGNAEYFAEMDRELNDGGRAALLHDLLGFDLLTVNLRQIPRTAALLEQKFNSLDPIEAWWLECLEAGTPTRSLSHWPELVSAQALYADYIVSAEQTGVYRRSTQTQLGMKLRKLLPAVERVRRTADLGEGRSWHYQLPPLEVCRKHFEREVGQRIWSAEEAEPGFWG